MPSNESAYVEATCMICGHYEKYDPPITEDQISPICPGCGRIGINDDRPLEARMAALQEQQAREGEP